MWDKIQSPLIAMIFVVIIAGVDFILGKFTNFGLKLYGYRAYQAAPVLLVLGLIWLAVMAIVGLVTRKRAASPGAGEHTPPAP